MTKKAQSQPTKKAATKAADRPRHKPSWEDDYDGKGSEALFENFRVVVHHHIHYPPDVWLMSVYGIREKVPLKSKTLAEAKTEVLEWFQLMLAETLQDAVELLMRSTPKPG